MIDSGDGPGGPREPQAYPTIEGQGGKSEGGVIVSLL